MKSKMFEMRFKILIAMLFVSFGSNAFDGRALVLMPEGEAFNSVFNGLNDDIGEEVEFIALNLEEATAESIQQEVQATDADALVLLGNSAIRKYKEYQALDDQYVPAIATASLYLDSDIEGMNDITGIRYEIPLVTSAVSYRALSESPVTKIGVIHREWMSQNIEENRAYCDQEGIELVSYVLPNESSRMQSNIRKGLRKLIAQGVDMIWVVNDNALVTPQTIQSSWTTIVGRHKLPVIVGIEALAESKLNMGTFAVVPDHYELGVQLADMVGTALDEDWDVSDIKIEEPLSIIKVLNTRISKKRGHTFSKEKLGSVGRVIEK